MGKRIRVINREAMLVKDLITVSPLFIIWSGLTNPVDEAHQSYSSTALNETLKKCGNYLS